MDKILVVDDEEGMRRLLKRILGDMGYKVYGAEGREDVLSIVEKKSVDVVILDWKLGGIRGIDILQELKKRRPKVGVIMISAYGTSESREEAKKLGAFEWVDKPFKIEDIIRSLAILKERRKKDFEVTLPLKKVD